MPFIISDKQFTLVVHNYIPRVDKEMSKKKADEFSTYSRHIILFISNLKEKEKNKILKCDVEKEMEGTGLH